MNGLIALLGSGEYLSVMEDVDRYLLANCGANGRKPCVVCLPTAAGQEGEKSISRWSKMGVEHFTRLGANVQALPVIDVKSANDPNYASIVENAGIIYFSGGNPSYLYRTMKDSLVWESAQKAWMNGAVYAGCSAGAMILGAEMPDVRAAGIRSTIAFGILPISSLLPHFNKMPLFGKPLIATLRRRLREGEIMIGVDEDTAIVGKINEEWTVMGKSQAHVFTKNESSSYVAGEKFTLKRQSP